MEKLNPCPFCASESVKVRRGIGMFMILCDECGATVSFYKKEGKEQAVEAWNRREGERKAYEEGMDEGWSAAEKAGRGF